MTGKHAKMSKPAVGPVHVVRVRDLHRAAPTVAAILLASVVLVWYRPGAAQKQDPPRPGVPAALETYLTDPVHLSSRDRQALVAGQPVTELLEADPSKEVAVFGAVWVNASPAEYVERVKDIESFERGGSFKDTTRISDPPVPADFAKLTLSDEVLADLRKCRVGDCIIKLGAEAIERFQAEIDWRRPTAKADANALFRRLLFEYVAGYREGGNARLAVYRDAARPTFVAHEFRSMVERLPGLAAWPDVGRFLLEYPAASLARSTDFLYWQEVTFGLRPTIRVNHLVIQQRGDVTVVLSKMLYATHYFWTALEVRVLVPDPGGKPGFWFVMVSRGRSDGLDGFLGRIIRGRVRNASREGTLAALVATKATLEGTPRRVPTASGQERRRRPGPAPGESG